jgi:hypothetical protein
MLDFGAVIKHAFFQVDEAATQALMDLRIHSPIVALGQKKPAVTGVPRAGGGGPLETKALRRT